MATRFYWGIPTGKTPYATSGWDFVGTDSRFVYRLEVTKQNIIPVTGGPDGYNAVGYTSVANPGKVSLFQFASPPLGAQTITGTLLGYAICKEQSSTHNCQTAIHCRVITSEGAVRGTLMSPYATLDGASEFTVNAASGTTGGTSRRFPSLSAPTTLSSVTVQDGDYILIDIGYYQFLTGLAVGHIIHTGDVIGSTDFSTEGSASRLTPWFEFSQTLVFSSGLTYEADQRQELTGDFLPGYLPNTESHEHLPEVLSDLNTSPFNSGITAPLACGASDLFPLSFVNYDRGGRDKDVESDLTTTSFVNYDRGDRDKDLESDKSNSLFREGRELPIGYELSDLGQSAFVGSGRELPIGYELSDLGQSAFVGSGRELPIGYELSDLGQSAFLPAGQELPFDPEQLDTLSSSVFPGQGQALMAGPDVLPTTTTKFKYLNRVYDTVAGKLVHWVTALRPDLTGRAYPGPGVFGTNTSDYVTEVVT